MAYNFNCCIETSLKVTGSVKVVVILEMMEDIDVLLQTIN